VGLGRPMTGTELEEVQALLERVLPDPRGFAGRLLQQAMTEYGQFAGPAATAFYEATTAENGTPSETVIVPDQWPGHETPIDVSILLAAALGACECWGLQIDCDLCEGQGSAGWTRPDPELFDEFVRPAIERLPGEVARSYGTDQVRADEESDNHQRTQGANA
jgi:hypothetical protein